MDCCAFGLMRMVLLCAAQIGAFAQHAPECLPGGHRILRNPNRSVDFDSTEIQNTAIQDLICDHSLSPGWYRFWINNKPAEMPTACVEMNRCGTQAPVWLSLKDASLPRPGEVRQLSACATWQFFHGSTKDCCLFRIPVTARNCGDFLLYYLQPTQGCMGYCAKVVPDVAHVLCPPGETDVNGRCQAAVPSLLSRPVITAELISRSVHLRCSFTPPAWTQRLGYHVAWARHVGLSMKTEIRQESTLETFSLMEMDGVHFRLGETFSCSVSTFTANSSHSRSAARDSENFYAGLKFSPDSLHITENAEVHKVTVHSTVPIACYNQDLDQRCGLPLALSVHDPDSLGLEAANVALSACQVALQPTACSNGSCGRAVFMVAAVTDFTRDGNRPSVVSVLPGHPVPRLWRNYIPASLKVTVKDVPTSICYSLTDPHVITLDGRYYENHQTGTFVLYRSLARDFEVHSRQWDCGSHDHAVTCNCGVAARDGNDVTVLDMCNSQPQETKPRLTLKDLEDGDGTRNRVRVLETHQGKKVTLIFPSGAFVRADVSDWGMSLSIRAPSVDYGSTQGLCGTFDHNINNDFLGADGRSFHADNLHHFIEDWRLPPGESLFDATPPKTAQVVRRPFCRCRAGYSTHHHGDRGNKNMYATESSCVTYEDVDDTSVFPSTDTTLEHSRGPGQTFRVLDMSAFSAPPLETTDEHDEDYDDDHDDDDDELDSDFRDFLSTGRSRQQTLFEFKPVFTSQSLSQTDLENFAYFFPEDHLAESRPEVRPRWPTPSGLTSATALEVCHLALANSTVGASCRELLGRRLDEAVDLCTLDLQLKDDLGWEKALLPYLENECERRLLENRTQRVLGVSGEARPGQVVMALRCPNFCSGNGRCTEWGCRCHPGFSLYDCSRPISQPAKLTDLENSGLCDLRVFDCRRVRVFGLGFIDSPNLSCHATRLKYVNGIWVPAEKQRTKASYLSSKALDCSVPPLSNTAIHTEDFTMDDKPYARWEITVTNDGSLYSHAKVLTIYDGVCQVCEASRSGLCKSKERTCRIDGMCLAEGDSNPSSSCLLCDPDTSLVTWSLNKANEPPVFHRPQDDLQTFEGENFVFQFAASDPEGSAILFQLEAGPPGAVLSPAGLLIWSVPTLPGEEEGRREQRTFRFTLSDECNARSSVAVEVTVVPCGCSAGGTCVTDVNFPAGSGKYLCVCPDRRHGDLCDLEVDECLSRPCKAGVCVDTAGGYRCECPPGRKGGLCLEDIDECEMKPCFPGVQCFNTFGSYSCSPCPKGMLGNGTACSAVIRPLTDSPTSVPHTDVQKIPDVPLHSPGIKTETFPKTLSGNSLQMRAEEAKKIPRTDPDGSETQTNTWRNIPRNSLGRTISETNKSVSWTKQTLNDDLRKEIDPNYSQANTDTSKNISGTTQIQITSNPPSETAARTSGEDQPPAGSGRSGVLNGSATCASRPCFPGVLCIDRRPPHVGYACGHCPPGLYGNGRICTKNTKAASSHLPQQQSVSKPSQPSHSSNNRVSQLHLPVVPARHGIKHLSSPVTRRNRGGELHQASGKEDSSGRRDAFTVASRNGPKTSVTDLHLKTNTAKSSTKEDSTTSFSSSREIFQLFHGEVKGSVPHNKVTPPISQHETHPQLNHMMPTRVKPWTAPQPDRPLTAALTAVSYLLSESEFSADGDEVEPGLPELPSLIPGLTLTMPGRPAHSTSTSLRRAGPPQRIRPVLSCADRPCFPGVQCEPAPDGGFHCGRCPVGYIGHGQTCRAVCKHPCGRNMACAAPNTCRCKPGYTGNNCQTAMCEPPCVNGGVCVAPTVCQCPRGFHGETCQEALCSSPCENGGVCVGRQSCLCPYGFVGPHCETMVCTRHCHHGGQCVAPDECECPPGWTGPSCQTAVCSPVCLNGGLCVRPNTCECPRGFYGARCQNAMCSPSCKNGGLCRRNNVCACLQGYTGTRCQKSVCEPMCMNGGRCVEPNVCDCPSGWQGKRCDKPSCLQKCLNGGECVGPNICHCTVGWGGALCQSPHCEQKCLYGSRCVRPNVCACRGGSSASLCSRRLPITQG